MLLYSITITLFQQECYIDIGLLIITCYSTYVSSKKEGEITI